jgi:hypothetical protein
METGGRNHELHDFARVPVSVTDILQGQTSLMECRRFGSDDYQKDDRDFSPPSWPVVVPVKRHLGMLSWYFLLAPYGAFASPVLGTSVSALIWTGGKSGILGLSAVLQPTKRPGTSAVKVMIVRERDAFTAMLRDSER